MYKRRSRSRLRHPAGASINTCSIPGKLPAAISPKIVLSVGTILQPTTVSVSLVSSSSKILLERAASIGSGLRNIIPTAYLLPSCQLFSSAIARKNESGFCINKPQPSPVLPSDAIPPRCCIRSKA